MWFCGRRSVRHVLDMFSVSVRTGTLSSVLEEVDEDFTVRNHDVTGATYLQRLQSVATCTHTHTHTWSTGAVLELDKTTHLDKDVFQSLIVSIITKMLKYLLDLNLDCTVPRSTANQPCKDSSGALLFSSVTNLLPSEDNHNKSRTLLTFI